MIEGKRADSARRRERVVQALDAALRSGEDITVSSFARAARVDRTFLYRHRDLLERIHAAATTPVEQSRTAAVSRTSLQTDLANSLERNARLTGRVRQLEKRLSEELGATVWAESGLGPRRTSTSSSAASRCWSSNLQTSAGSWRNGVRSWRRPAPPTAN